MPTYEYACRNGHEFEEFQSMVAPPLETCPICGATAERKISGGSGLIFKGSGFYITDYAKKHSSDSTKAKSSDSASTPAPSSTNSESKS